MDKDDEEVETDEDVAPIIIGDERLPESWMDPEDVETLDVPYSTRAPGDWIISGPLGEYRDFRGGRPFDSWEDAEEWAKEKYGAKFKGRVADLVNSASNRWGFFIGRLSD